MTPPADGDILVPVPADARETTNLGAYLGWLEAEKGLRFADYDEFWRWSIDAIEDFWETIWVYFGVQSTEPYECVLRSRTMPGAEWFPGARINYARHLIEVCEQRGDDVAIVARSQSRDEVVHTFSDVVEEVARIRVGLVRLGIGPGDRVVGYLPNAPEALIAMVACASIGAVWASVAPEFGQRSVIDRIGQIEPKVLLAIGSYHYGAKEIDIRDRVADVVAATPSIEHVVDVEYGSLRNDTVETWATLRADRAPLRFTGVPFDHPLVVLFSSGTTGLPKAIVHGHGGILLEHLKGHSFSWDLQPGDRGMWFSTTAWMIWNAVVSCLLHGTSIVMLDGNPLYPDMLSQWRIAAEVGATHLGTAPAYLMGCRKAGIEPTETFDMSRLRVLMASGSPVPAEGYRWVNERFGDGVDFNVGSGGTDVCTALVGTGPMTPTYVGEMSHRLPGVAAFAFDGEGKEVIGELGELVITEPMPSMPVGFWGDEDGSRLRSTYFDHYPGVFRFGDWVRFRENGSCIITGRSDATLNRGGVRLGTAELYRVVEEHPDIVDSLVVHLEDPDGGAGELILFVVSERVLDDDLRAEVGRALRRELSPRHVPDTVVAVPMVPRNLTQKKLELPVKKILQGAEPASVVSRDAMGNPESLDPILAYAATRILESPS